MAYIGNSPGVSNTILGVDRFNGTGACTQFTLTRTTDDANSLEVLVNSIQQDPINSYSVAGGVITFTESPSSGANNITVFYRSTSIISFTNVTTAQIADGAITLPKMAGGVLPSTVAVFTTANAAFLQANTPSHVANSAAIYANGAFTAANAAFLQANTPSHVANSAAIYANGAFTTANSANANGSITAAKLDVKSANGVGATVLPGGTTAQRPSGTSGSIRYNTTTGQFEGYTASSWGSIGGGATGGGGDTVFILNANTVTANYTIEAGYNAISAGPLIINSPAIVTISNGSNWVIV